MYNTYASVWAYVAGEQARSGEQVQFEHIDDDSFWATKTKSNWVITNREWDKNTHQAIVLQTTAVIQRRNNNQSYKKKDCAKNEQYQ